MQSRKLEVCSDTEACPGRITARHSSALAFDTSKLSQFGSLPLDDLTPVIAKLARLQQEIKEALSKGNKKQEDVMCIGMRFPAQWKNLGGLRVSPYSVTSARNGCKSMPPFDY
jgi:hypothetical protein